MRKLIDHKGAGEDEVGPKVAAFQTKPKTIARRLEQLKDKQEPNDRSNGEVECLLGHLVCYFRISKAEFPSDVFSFAHVF